MLAVRFALPDASVVGLNTALKESDADAVAQAIFNNPISFLLAFGLLAVLITFADASTDACAGSSPAPGTGSCSSCCW